ncbi:MAG TPA: hypothetical protein VMC80_02880 [Patescibacteria group bacterium]|nr:hypothetical protein [Patescibacteria group bacterium]
MRISEEKKDKISEQILALLYSINPKSLFVAEIAKEIARDEEFVKEMLISLKKKNLVVEIRKNPKGIEYLKRARWKISDLAYNAYKQHQR